MDQLQQPIDYQQTNHRQTNRQTNRQSINNQQTNYKMNKGVNTRLDQKEFVEPQEHKSYYCRGCNKFFGTSYELNHNHGYVCNIVNKVRNLYYYIYNYWTDVPGCEEDLFPKRR